MQKLDSDISSENKEQEDSPDNASMNVLKVSDFIQSSQATLQPQVRQSVEQQDLHVRQDKKKIKKSQASRKKSALKSSIQIEFVEIPKLNNKKTAQKQKSQARILQSDVATTVHRRKNQDQDNPEPEPLKIPSNSFEFDPFACSDENINQINIIKENTIISPISNNQKPEQHSCNYVSPNASTIEYHMIISNSKGNNINNTMMFPTHPNYHLDYIAYMLRREEQHGFPLSTYSLHYQQIPAAFTRKNMAIVFLYLQENAQTFGLQRVTFYQAKSILMRSLQHHSKLNIDLQTQLQVMAIASLIIAAKVQEIVPISAQCFTLFSFEEIVMQEQRILKALKWELHDVTISNWAFLFMQQWDRFTQTNRSYNELLEQVNFFTSESDNLAIQVMEVLDLISCDYLHQDYPTTRLVLATMYISLSSLFAKLQKVTKLPSTLYFDAIFDNYLAQACAFLGCSVHALLPIISFAQQFFLASNLFIEEQNFTFAQETVQYLSLNCHSKKENGQSNKRQVSLQTHSALHQQFMQQRFCNENANIVQPRRQHF